MRKRKISLVDDWRKAKTWFSLHAMAYAAAIQVVWVELPEDIKSNIPSKLVNILTAVLLVLGIVGRLVKQGESNGASK